MKKLLIFISIILCLSMLFVSCTDKNQDDEEEEYAQPVDNVEDNVNMLIKELNKAETLQDLVNSSKTVVDGKEVVSQLKKISAAGKMSLTGYMDGKKDGTFDGEFAVKKNNFYLSYTEDGTDTYGINAKINEAMNFVFAAWSKDGDKIEIDGATAVDLEAYFEAYNLELENYFNIDTNDIPVDLNEIKLPVFTKDNIVYEDGKYVIDKDFLYDAVIVTIDAAIDSAKNNGEELPDDFDDQYDEIKKIAKDVFEVIDFKLYYFIEFETINGYGVYCNLDIEKVADVLDTSVEELGGVDYMKGTFEISTKHQLVDFEMKMGKDINKIEYKVDHIFDGKNLCGYDMNYNLSINSHSSDSSKNESYDGYSYEYYENDMETVTKQSIRIKLDLSAFEKANADVIVADVSLYEKNESYYEYGNEGGVVDVQEGTSVEETTIEFSVKTTEPNKADVNIEGTSKINSENNGIKENSSSTIRVEGTVEFTTDNVTVPGVDKTVEDAMNEALKDPIDTFN